MKLTPSLKQRFVNDYGIPINRFDDEIWDKLVELYDKDYDVKNKLARYQRVLDQYDSEQEFFDAYTNLMNSIIDDIKNKKSYQDFINMDMNQFKTRYSYPNINLYIEQNVGKTFISIDLSKANYQALKYVNPDIVNNSINYSEFLSKYTTKKYFIDSKYLRQVIFGNLNPKRQQTVEKFLVDKIIDLILKKNDGINIISSNSDELILEDCDLDTFKLTLEIFEKLGLEVKIERFRLDGVIDRYGRVVGYTKTNHTVILKGCSKTFFVQIYKHLNNIPIEESDLEFMHEGCIAKFKEPIFEEKLE